VQGGTSAGASSERCESPASREGALAGTRSGRRRAAEMNTAASMARASTTEGDRAGASTERRVGGFHGGHGKVEDELEQREHTKNRTSAIKCLKENPSMAAQIPCHSTMPVTRTHHGPRGT
jgi:hypothetical protein